MTVAQVPDDIFRRLASLERRVKILEGGPQGDALFPVSVRTLQFLGTSHIGAEEVSGGRSGDLQVGTDKLWVNDGGIWSYAALTTP